MPEMKEDWLCFANCKWDPASGEWEMMKRDIVNIF
jgi:adenylylsulfate reductase subunit A